MWVINFQKHLINLYKISYLIFQESTTKIEESGSNLIPTVSKEKTSMINDVIHHLLIMINDNTSEPHQTSKNRSSLNLNRIGSTNDETQSIRRKTLNIVRSYTQPEIVISNACRTNWANRQLDKVLKILLNYVKTINKACKDNN